MQAGSFVFRRTRTLHRPQLNLSTSTNRATPTAGGTLRSVSSDLGSRGRTTRPSSVPP